MMITYRTLMIASLAAVAVSSAPAQTTPREDYICTSGTERRVVSVYNGRAFNSEKQRTGGCHVDYTRAGKTGSLWSSANDPAFCTKMAAELITKLIKGNFSCKTVEPEKPEDSTP